jgi:DNA modification methylase
MIEIKRERGRRKGSGRRRSETIRGDSLSILRSLKGSTVDVVLADPPYGISFRGRSGRRILNDERPFIWWLYDAYRVLRPNGVILCFCRWDVANDFRWALELAGFKVRSEVIWDREIHGMGDTKASFAPRHDTVWFATKGHFAFQSGRPASVIAVQRLIRPLAHPTEKPVSLLIKLLQAVARPNALVLDPFMGSGSAGEACHWLGLRYVGIEKDRSFFGKATRRLEKLG